MSRHAVALEFDASLEVPAARARGWDPLLLALALYIAVGVGRVHQLFAGLAPLHLALLAWAAAVLLFLLDRSPARTLWGALREPAGKAVAGLCLWVLLSVPGALVPGLAAQRGLAFFQTALIVVVMAGAARDRGDVERLAGVYFACVALYAVIVLERFHGSASTRLADLYYYDANDFATVAVMALPLGVYFLTSRRPAWQRLGAGGGVAALLVAFIWAGSRGGFLALLAVLAFLLVRFSAVPAVWRIGAAALVVLVFAAATNDTWWERMQSLEHPEQGYNYTDEWGRRKVWTRGIGYMMANPVVGVGADNFPTAEGTLSPLARRQEVGLPVKWSAPHNSFIQAGAELGVPGLLLFVAVIASGFGAAAAARRLDPAGAALAQAIEASLVAFVVGGFFLSFAYADALYALLGLAAALRRTASA